MRPWQGRIGRSGVMKALWAVLCALGAALLAYSLCILVMVYGGEYHGKDYNGMLEQAMNRVDDHLVGNVLQSMSLCPVTREYDSESKEVSFERICQYWKEVAEGIGTEAPWLDYAVLLSEQQGDGFLGQYQYLYRSEGFTQYTDAMQVQAFREYYQGSYSLYGTILYETYLSDWGGYPGEKLPFGKPYYLTVLYQHRSSGTVWEDAQSCLSAKQFAFVRMLHRADNNAGFVIVPALMFLTGLVMVCRTAGRRKGRDGAELDFLDWIPFELWAGVVMMFEIFLLVGMGSFLDNSQAEEWFSFEEYSLVFCGTLFIMGMAGLMLLSTFCARLKAKRFWQTTLLGLVTKWFKRSVVRAGNWAAAHIPLAARLVIALPVLGVISLLEAALISDCGMGYAALFCMGRLVSFAMLVYLLWGYSRLRDGAARIAEGKLEQPVKEKGLTPDYRLFARNLNCVGKSIQIAVEERLKSERLKTELITNVSHDIKTPLTSIINYVDLLQKEDVGETEKKEYLDILAHQSSRLKKLIQDLIDASKASTGAVEVRMEQTDLNMLVGQVTGEYQDKLDAADLTLVVKNKCKDLRVQADSNLLWRVLDNLFANVLKYTLPGTRVYLETDRAGGEALLSISNISKAELGISGEELMERFVRGDGSRNTEGSGLGLSIAKSLMELMGGELRIVVDGDMFKAVVKLKI
ncbi:MAG: HAMP domain-containing histidine kinase [Lachnospiraceae bacterium]|nr:HAMP domain-containing histidine kinase [Lachnospiraceae bacterium]